MATKRISELDPISRAKIAVKVGKGSAGYDMGLGASTASNVRRRSQTMASEAAEKDAMNLAPTKSHSRGPTMAQRAAGKDAFKK